LYVKNNTNVKYNLITRQYELLKNGIVKEVDTKELSSIYVSAKEVIPDIHKSDLIDYIMSDRTAEYNPLIDFIELHKGDKINKSRDLIRELSDCIIAPDNKKIDKDFNYTFIKKWLVGMIASIYGNHTNLMLILCGTKQNTGKTEFFRRLLPKEINDSFYSECRFKEINTKDDEIAMTCNLVMFWNELGGFEKKTNEDIKEICDKKAFYGRIPYGKIQTKMPRLAALCGSSNKEELLSDPSGNRRIIPIYVGAINHEKYNAIDKTALFMQAYCLFIEGEKYELKETEIDYLNINTTVSNITITEEELLLTYFTMPNFTNGLGSKIDFEDMNNEMLITWSHEPKQKMMTNSQLLEYLQSRYSIKNLNYKSLGSILNKCKFPKKQINRGGNNLKVYFLQELGDENDLTFE
jgi:predicted P-loop ATPase